VKELLKDLPIVLFCSNLASLAWFASPKLTASAPQVAAFGTFPPVPVAMQVVITVSMLATSIFIILSKRYSPTDKHWAYGTLGTILGFWLPK
jgi:hypothetical protein